MADINKKAANKKGLTTRRQTYEKTKIKKETKKEYDPDDKGVSLNSQEKPKGRVRKKPEKAGKTEKSDGLKQTKKKQNLATPEKPKKRPARTASQDSDENDSVIESKKDKKKANPKKKKNDDSDEDYHPPSPPGLPYGYKICSKPRRGMGNKYIWLPRDYFH